MSHGILTHIKSFKFSAGGGVENSPVVTTQNSAYKPNHSAPWGENIVISHKAFGCKRLQLASNKRDLTAHMTMILSGSAQASSSG